MLFLKSCCTHEYTFCLYFYSLMWGLQLNSHCHLPVSFLVCKIIRLYLFNKCVLRFVLALCYAPEVQKWVKHSLHLWGAQSMGEDKYPHTVLCEEYCYREVNGKYDHFLLIVYHCFGFKTKIGWPWSTFNLGFCQWL